MKRREYVLGLFAGISGLTGCTGESTPDGPSTTETATGATNSDGPSTVETTIVEKTGPASPLSLSVETLRETMTAERPAQIQLTVRNTGESPVTYMPGAPPPFGVLTAGEHTLWTDEYVKSSYVSTQGRQVSGISDIGVEVTLSSEETRSDTYEFHAPPGTYTIEQGESFVLDDVQYRIQITVH